MKKILLVCDHYPMSPRVLKVRNSLLISNPNRRVDVMCWNRSGQRVVEEFVYSIDLPIGYGSRFKSILGLVLFVRALRSFVKKNGYDVLHAIDLAMLFSVCFLSKKIRIIYEVYDFKTSKYSILSRFIWFLETRILLKRVYGIIYSSVFFPKKYEEISINKNRQIILPNAPSKITQKIQKKSAAYKDVQEAHYTIGFIGNVRHERILRNLVEVVLNKENASLLIAGDGPALERLKQMFQNFECGKKIKFTGRFEANELAGLYGACESIWAAYPPDNENVYYAVSNKYYECIAFKKPIIVSKRTLLADKVVAEGLGLTVNPYDLSSISDCVDAVLRGNLEHAVGSLDVPEQYWEDFQNSLLRLY